MTPQEQRRIEAYFRQQRRDRWLVPLILALTVSGIVSIVWLMLDITRALHSLTQILNP
jgi:hypothetical protein